MVIFKKKNTLANLYERSAEIFDIFTQTQEQCKLLNDEIATVANEKQEEANKLLAEVKELDAIALKNSNLASKISQFLNC